MTCGECKTENKEGSLFCKQCGAKLGEGGAAAAEAVKPARPPWLASFLTIVWQRKGPILMAFFTVLMMAVVFAPWAFFKLQLLGIEVTSNTFSGWAMFIPRILFYLSIIPLLVSLLMIAGIGTRRRVVETHICTFFAGVMFTIWVVIFALSEVFTALIKNVKVVSLSVSSGQIATIFFLIGFLIAIVVTTYDRGKMLTDMKDDG